MLSLNTIHHGHCLDLLKKIPDNSIDTVITSPPYYALRNYDTKAILWGDWYGELGQEPNIYLYLNHLTLIFQEIYRVLKITGSCWINFGDSYNKGSREIKLYNHNTRKKVFGTNNGIKNKSLLQIPHRFAIKMTDELKFILRNEIIWYKPNALPESVTDRFTRDFEHLFFFSKSPKYYFKQQFEPIADSTITRLKGSNNITLPNTQGLKKFYNKTDEELEEIRKKGRNKRCVWNISVSKSKCDHYATYPTKLLEIPIKACCPPNGIILDPFFGSGTTGYVALKLKRNFIGIELNKDYCKIAKQRIKALTKVD